MKFTHRVSPYSCDEPTISTADRRSAKPCRPVRSGTYRSSTRKHHFGLSLLITINARTGARSNATGNCIVRRDEIVGWAKARLRALPTIVVRMLGLNGGH